MLEGHLASQDVLALLRWSHWGPRFPLLLSRSSQTEATPHGEPRGNSGKKRIPAFQQPSDCSHSPLWSLRKLRKEKTGCWSQVVRCVSKGMISVRWLVHLPTHRKVLSSLTLDAAPWFWMPKRFVLNKTTLNNSVVILLCLYIWSRDFPKNNKEKSQHSEHWHQWWALPKRCN